MISGDSFQPSVPPSSTPLEKNTPLGKRHRVPSEESDVPEQSISQDSPAAKNHLLQESIRAKKIAKQMKGEGEEEVKERAGSADMQKIKESISGAFNSVSKEYKPQEIEKNLDKLMDTVKKLVIDFNDKNKGKKLSYDEYRLGTQLEFVETVHKFIESQLIEKMEDLNPKERAEKGQALVDVALRLRARIDIARDFNGTLDFHSSNHSGPAIAANSAKLTQEWGMLSQRFAAIGEFHDYIMTWKENRTRDSGIGIHQCEGLSAKILLHIRNQYQKLVEGYKGYAKFDDDDNCKKAIERTLPKWIPDENKVINGAIIEKEKLDKLKKYLDSTEVISPQETGDIEQTINSIMSDLPYMAPAVADISECMQEDNETWVQIKSCCIFLEDKMKPDDPEVIQFRSSEPKPSTIQKFVNGYMDHMSGQKVFADGCFRRENDNHKKPFELVKACLDKLSQSPQALNADKLNEQKKQMNSFLENYYSIYCSGDEIRKDALKGIDKYKENLSGLLSPQDNEIKQLKDQGVELGEGNPNKPIDHLIAAYDKLIVIPEQSRTSEQNNAIIVFEGIFLAVRDRLDNRMRELRTARLAPSEFEGVLPNCPVERYKTSVDRNLSSKWQKELETTPENVYKIIEEFLNPSPFLNI